MELMRAKGNVSARDLSRGLGVERDVLVCQLRPTGGGSAAGFVPNARDYSSSKSTENERHVGCSECSARNPSVRRRRVLFSSVASRRGFVWIH